MKWKAVLRGHQEWRNHEDNSVLRRMENQEVRGAERDATRRKLPTEVFSHEQG
jgi:hypothetical protein